MSGYMHIEHDGKRYDIIQSGEYPNGKPRYWIMMDCNQKKRHLKADERKHALDMLNAGDSVQQVADTMGVSYHTIYRLSRHRCIERKRRRDAGQCKTGIHPEAIKLFDSIYIQNAQGPNVKLAYDLMMRRFEGFKFPYKFFVRRGHELEMIRLAHHQQAQFEKLYTPRVRRDLWAESRFMRRVSLDGWVVPDRVLKNTGLEHLLGSKFEYIERGKRRDVSLVCIFAFDECTGEPLAWEAYEKSITGDDVMKLLLEVVLKWGRPESWLVDNGSEFTNEQVQRFLRGLYTTEEHNEEQRIIFSEAYQPYGKGRHERQHKIFKDEFCAFSRSYSPNQKQSRKPTRQLSYVKPEHTLQQWKEKFSAYLTGFYRERQRISWMNPAYPPHHPENADRPRTLNEAFDRAYAQYNRVDVDKQKLAFLYGKKFRARLKGGLFVAPSAFAIGRRISYLPAAIPIERYAEEFEIVVNPSDFSEAWVCDLNHNFVCEASSVFKGQVAAPDRTTAAAYRKVRNRVAKLAKEHARMLAEQTDIEELYKARTEKEQPRSTDEKSLYKSTPSVAEQVDDLLDDEMVELISQQGG